MKIGDTLAVAIDGIHVTNGTIVAIDHKDAVVEISIPATRVVMGLKTSIVVPEPTISSDKQVIIDGTYNPDQLVADEQLAGRLVTEPEKQLEQQLPEQQNPVDDATASGGQLENNASDVQSSTD